MADSIKYAVSMTPIETLTNEASTEFNVIGGDIGKTLGGAASITVSGGSHDTVGWSSGTPTYLEAGASDAKTALGGENAAYNGVFIKNTGYTYVAGELGVATTDYVNVWVEYSSGSYIKIFQIDAGGAVFMPHTQSLGASCTWHVSSSGSGNVAVEYACIS